MLNVVKHLFADEYGADQILLRQPTDQNDKDNRGCLKPLSFGEGFGERLSLKRPSLIFTF